MTKQEAIDEATRIAERDGIEMRVTRSDYHEEPYAYQPADWGLGVYEETVTVIRPS